MKGYIIYRKKRYPMKALSLIAALILAIGVASCDRQELFDAAKMAGEEPEGITKLRVTGVTVNSISFEWDPVDGATAYRLYRSPDSEFTAPYVLTGSLITSFNDSGTMIEGGITFYYRVGVVLGTGEEFSNTVETRTGTLPMAPASLNASAGVDQVTLTWSEVPGATYNIHRNNEPMPFVTGITATNYVDVIVGDWTYNSYKVKAVNAFGVSDFSPSADAYAKLGPVGNLTVVESSSTSVTLSWAPVRNASYYTVKATGLSDVPNGSSTTYTYSTLAKGTTYDFQVVVWSYGGMFMSATPVVTLDTFTRVSRTEVSTYETQLTMTPAQTSRTFTPVDVPPAGTVFIYRTQTGGLLGKFEVLNDVSSGTNLVIRYITYAGDGNVFYESNSFSIENGYCLDLDTGLYTTNSLDTEVDFLWSTVLGVSWTFTPKNMAGFIVLE